MYLDTETTRLSVNEAVQGKFWTLRLSSTWLNCYKVSRQSFGPRLSAALANNSWTLVRSWHWSGVILNGNLNSSTLIWRVREFNSMNSLFHDIWPQSQRTIPGTLNLLLCALSVTAYAFLPQETNPKCIVFLQVFLILLILRQFLESIASCRQSVKSPTAFFGSFAEPSPLQK